MKNWVGCLLVMSLVQCAQKSPEEGVKIVGSVEQLAEGGFVRIEKVQESGAEPIDTVEVNDGFFEAYLKVDEPSFYRVNFNGRQYVTLILTGDETEVEVNAHGNDPKGFSEVSGSYDTEYKSQMDVLLESYRTEATIIQGRLRQAQGANDQAAFMQANNELITYTQGVEKKLKGIIREASPSLAAIYGIQMIDPEKNITFLDSIYKEMNEEMPENYLVQNLSNTVNSKKKLAIGQEAPEISLANPDGEVVTLSSLRGKYVLIDFWAAWCRPCRAENPNVVRMYNKYSGENFEIYGVSLDKTKAAWLKAIEQDGVPWIHVSDLKFWQSVAAKTYNVSAIPATFLIDPEGKIIAKNLRGPSLEAKLKEIFG
ncbi:MAG: redoxin domain-containing protein [Ekhidna sp.]